MREIKFRGLDVNGNWYYGYLSVSQGLSGQPPKGYYISNESGMPWAYNVMPETVGEYIGKQDIHGVEIYSGMEIQVRNWGVTDEVLGVTTVVWDVDELGFRYEDCLGAEDVYDQFRRVEILK